MIEKIRTAAPGDCLWDTDEKASVKGLHVRVSMSGERAFYFYYRTKGGVQRRPKIGSFGEITLAEARKRAKALSDIVALGGDPKGQWDEQKKELTTNELFELAWEKHWSQARYIESGWGRQAKNSYEKNIKPRFGTTKISSISPLKVKEWHDTLKDKPYAANRCLEILSKMFMIAEQQELRDINSNPCTRVTAHPEKSRKRFATPQELQRIHMELQKHSAEHPHGVAFLYLLMFSGSRPRAIEKATWEMVERKTNDAGEEYGILSFDGKSTGKTGEEERVIIPPQAMRLLTALPRYPGMTLTGIKMPRRLWAAIKKEVGCDDLWARDLRRTFATIGMSNGVGKDTVGELLNHHSSETTKIYAKLTDDSRVAAAFKIADTISAIATTPNLKLVEG